MNERLKGARKALGFNQTDFGKRLGVTPGAISHLESGKNKLTEQLITSVCREFGINEAWLRTGEGEMRVTTTDGLVRQVVEAFNLSKVGSSILECYVNLPEASRTAIDEFILDAAARHAATIESGTGEVVSAVEEISEAAATEFDVLNRPLSIEEKVDLYRHRLILDEEKKAAGSSTTSGSIQTGSPTHSTRTGKAK